MVNLRELLIKFIIIYLILFGSELINGGISIPLLKIK